MIELCLEQLERRDDSAIIREPSLIQRVDDRIELFEERCEEGRRRRDENCAVDQSGELGQVGGERASGSEGCFGVHFEGVHSERGTWGGKEERTWYEYIIAVRKREGEEFERRRRRGLEEREGGIQILSGEADISEDEMGRNYTSFLHL